MTLRVPALLLGSLALLSACADSSSGPDPEPPRPLSAALVSSPIVLPGASRGAAVVVGQAYVSMEPGTEPEGRYVEVTNLRNGAQATALVRFGGFDPVAVEADAEDTLSVKITLGNQTQTTAYTVVPRRSRAKVVRTSPPASRTDVPLNSVLAVVFSQPMDSASVVAAVHLRQSGVEVPATITAVAENGAVLSGRIVPASPLAPLTTYELSVSSAVRSLDGDTLGAAVTSQFSTLDPAAVFRLRLVHASDGVGPMDLFVDGVEVVSDLPYLGATGYLELAAGPHDIWSQVRDGTLWEDIRVFAPGEEYTSLPCCAGFPSGSLLQDNNTAPPPGQARIRVIDYSSISASVNIYLTAPGAELKSVAPITINVLDATRYWEILAGSYRVRVTPFDSDVVMLDSGTLTFLDGQVRTLVLADAPDRAGPTRLLILQDRN